MRLLLLAAAAPLLAADWAGSAACRSCHAKQFERHAASAHAGALHAESTHPLVLRFHTGDKPILRDGFLFGFTGGAMEGYDRENSLELPLEWAFGAGKQAVTFLARLNPEWHLEFSQSYYPTAKRFLLSPGHGGFKPSTLKEAAGQIRDREQTARCFRCHSTGPVIFDSAGSVDVREPGVQCEACHGPAGDHVTRHSKLGSRKLAPKAATQLCAKCHDQTAKAEDAWFVRSQPASLARSQCFLKSKGKIGCLTCHDAHGETVSQNTTCASCHKKLPKGHGGNCVECHMPSVTPQAGLKYANHRIAIYAPGSPLTPLPSAKRK